MQAARGTPLNRDETPSAAATSAGSTGRRHAWVPFLLAAAVAYAVDLTSKQWALTGLVERDIRVIGDLLVLHLTFNPGAAFSMGANLTPLLTLVAIAACMVVLWLALRVRSRVWAVALGLLLAGAGGNLTDRLFRDPGPFRGHVVDLFRLPNWPVFNVADIAINVAVALILIQMFRGIRLDGTREER